MIDVYAILGQLARHLEVDPVRLSVIELNRSGPSDTLVALLAFAPDRADPLAFIKASPDADNAAVLRREFAQLERLARAEDDAFARSVPQPLYCGPLGRLTVLAETAKAGPRMKNLPPDVYFASPAFRRHYRLAVQWLAAFHEALAAPASAAQGRDAAAEVERYRRTHRVSARLDGLLDAAVRAVERVELPACPTHGDFCTANVVLPPDGSIFVIDWEYLAVPSWPLADLLYFTSSTWCIPYAKGASALSENYRRMFFDDHRFSDLVRESMVSLAGRIGLAAELILHVATLSWVGFANRKHDELQADPRIAPGRHMPLIMIDDGACLNLEILAERGDRFGTA